MMRHRRNYNEPGHAHELTFSCYQKYPFLKADRTCQWLLEAIHAARVRWDFELWAYVFMPDHAHLIIRPRDACYDMGTIRRAIKAPVARRAIAYLEAAAPEWIPRITRRRGSRNERLFWQSGGGYDRNITEPQTLMRMIAYIHNNPVREGLIQTAAAWKWSSAGWYINQTSGPMPVDPIPPQWLYDVGG